MNKRLVLVTLVLALLSAGVLVSQAGAPVATIRSDTFSGETVLPVKWVSDRRAAPDHEITLESRDGTMRETARVHSVHGMIVVVTERIRYDYPQGSRVYQ